MNKMIRTLFFALITTYSLHAEFRLYSSGFKNLETIPLEYTCLGLNQSPGLSWIDPPAGTKSFALTLQDPDAPGGVFLHWMVYNISPEAQEISPNIGPTPAIENGALQGLNDFHHIGYGGPCPPLGQRHRYIFTLYALDNTPDLPSVSDYGTFQGATESHVLKKTELTGFFN